MVVGLCFLNCVQSKTVNCALNKLKYLNQQSRFKNDEPGQNSDKLLLIGLNEIMKETDNAHIRK